MKEYAAVPGELVNGWQESVQSWPGGKKIKFHYHDVDEWLTVVSGEITFFTLADAPFQVDVGRALHIPRGEVHRVEVGSRGVEYRMFVPIAVPTFANTLEDEEVEALRCNLQFPEYEDGPPENGREFFKDALSERLVFCRANGKCEGKQEFLAGLSGEGNRSSSGSLQVLNKTSNGIFISTVVQMGKAKQTKWYTNVRFLEKDDEEKLRCRIWVNYPQPVSS
jgi:hypothetical protein